MIKHCDSMEFISLSTRALHALTFLFRRHSEAPEILRFIGTGQTKEFGGLRELLIETRAASNFLSQVTSKTNYNIKQTTLPNPVLREGGISSSPTVQVNLYNLSKADDSTT